MVQNPRTPARPDHVRPLNTPRQVTVLSSNGWPSALLESGRSVQITAVEDCWCIDDEWWRDRVQRRYFQVATATGSRRTLYHDVIADRWFEQRY